MKWFQLGFLACLVALPLAAPHIVRADTYTWDGGFATDGRWGNGNNWVGDTPPTFNTAADLIFHTNGAGQLSTYTQAARTIRSLTFNEFADADIVIRTTTTATGTTAADLTFQADTGNASIIVDPGASASSITVGTGGGNIILNSDLDIVHNGSGELLLGRPVTGSGGITKTGTGTMRFNQQANSFTGSITINEGTLIDGGATAGGSLGTGPKTITLGGGTLLFERAYGGNSVMGDKSFITTATTSSIIRYNDLSASTRNFTITGATESATLNGGLWVDNVSSAGGADAMVWNLTTTGNGLFSYSGTNDDVLNNLNDQRFQVSGDLSGHTGGIEIRKGVWLANGASALGGGAIHIGVTATAGSAAISLNSSSAVTIGNAVNVRSGAGMRLIDNSNASGVARSWTGLITLDGTLTYRSNFDDEFSSTSALTGTGGFVKLGTGRLDLRGSNGGYSGNITVSEGELRVLQASMGSGAVSVASGAHLNLQRTSGSIAYANEISGAGNITVGGGNLIALGGSNTSTGDITVGGSGTTLRIDNASFNASSANILLSAASSLLRLNANAADQTIANVISGNGSVVKLGNFTTVLSADNSYGNMTTVSAGTLIVNGDQSSAGGDVIVNFGSTLGGSGVVGGNTTVAAGAFLTGGTNGATGHLSFGQDLDASGSTWLVDLVRNVSGDSDRIIVAGQLNITGASLMDQFTGTYSPGNYTIATYTGLTGTFSGYSASGLYVIGGNEYQLTYGATAITLTAVPEPQVFLLMFLSICAFVILKRRQARLMAA